MADGSKRPVCAVVGVGPGNGEALARRFAADGYSIALMARRTELTAKLAAELPGAKAYACDVTEAASVEAAFAAMRSDLGDVDALIYNAGSGVWGNVEEVKAEDLERSWRVNTLGLFLTGRRGDSRHAPERAGGDHRRRRDRLAPRRGRRGGVRAKQDGAARARRIDGPPSLAGGHPCRADRRRRRGRRAGDALAVHRPPGRFLHRSRPASRRSPPTWSNKIGPPGASKSRRGRSRKSGERGSNRSHGSRGREELGIQHAILGHFVSRRAQPPLTASNVGHQAQPALGSRKCRRC